MKLIPLMSGCYIARNKRSGLRRTFVAYYYFVGIDHWSFGFHVCPSMPNIEIHVPFGFFRIGWQWLNERQRSVTAMEEFIRRRTFGLAWYRHL